MALTSLEKLRSEKKSLRKLSEGGRVAVLTVGKIKKKISTGFRENKRKKIANKLAEKKSLRKLSEGGRVALLSMKNYGSDEKKLYKYNIDNINII